MEIDSGSQDIVRAQLLACGPFDCRLLAEAKMSLEMWLYLTSLNVLPAAIWLFSDFFSSSTIRRIVGVVAFVWSYGVAAFVASFRDFEANLYFAGATKVFLENSVNELKSGNAYGVECAWSRANDSFIPTYESRGGFREIVDNAVLEMKSARARENDAGPK